MKMYIDFENQQKCFSDPITILRSNDYTTVKQQLDAIEKFTQQGFYAVGYLAYESAMGFNQANRTKKISNSSDALPVLLFGIYRDYSIVESSTKNDYQPSLFDLKCDTSIEEYNQKIDYIREQIELGNTYQTNYTIQFSAPFNDNAFNYYKFLQKNNQAHYCAYLEFEHYQILSISPELFFKLDNQTITTRPMKGTAARGLNNQHDKQQLETLFSEKNQAENMMIVDLLRNDLSRIAKTGSVIVPKLFSTEKYPTVWQLTSTIQAELAENVSLYQIFQALFPCGSITGAPKTSTMRIIADTENSPRGIYCGTIGYIKPYRKAAIFNIPIRTLTIHNQQIHYGVGGGITWDSTSHDEYEEILAKTAILNSTTTTPRYLIESLLLENGQFLLLNEHLTRLTDSASYFDFKCDIESIKLQLVKLANSDTEGSYKIRILLQQDGQWKISKDVINTAMNINEIVLAPQCVNNKNVYLYHKTSNREHFPQLTIGKEYINFNQYNEITEFVNGNLVLLINNQWVTPKIESGLLAGTMRQFYLDKKQIIEKTILINELLNADKIAFINSVRKWVEIDNKVFDRFKRLL
ncbi:aminodeoxychorismate synthase component I [Gilliamella sp. B2840]|uniref:aminodeoxychorismate synthase component I n=1 Tax=unclassified Gilliamella TaxID=2685620 RepID=UPI002269C3CE|nr:MULTISPECIES: aminodeoxychorismate synthase component I [unclassified Gilliamella]MCX8655449.1 aminodeoxychorismate synthase component I [Gilliamella sp. B2894]MCX8694965.1 aminodeoxychorismate synthase component I [Gilliamella sp. B2881]MCX8695449.1 aminodeoxychorismate synthase component I [Gilliamella sp. B2828]MCX8698716.1 aminodeoxychorismate synthase component I [Gilliamella sp. B3000]MCX8700031.1 aminodeoxychorismate synthase component I [Gilliamella sp. B2840]